MARWDRHGTTSNFLMHLVYIFSGSFRLFGNNVYRFRAFWEVLEYRLWLQKEFNVNKVLPNKQRMINFLIGHLNDGPGRDVLVVEFGVAFGETAKILLDNINKPVTYHGFDTFTGLPKAWRGLPKGAISAGGVAEVRGRQHNFPQGTSGTNS